MALSHILAAITAEADAEIAAAERAHAIAVGELTAAHERATSTIRSTVKQQKTDRLHQLKKRAEDHSDMMKRHAVLQRKQELLDEFYAAATKELSALPTAEAERLLSGWIAKLPKGGTIIPSKAHEQLLKKLAGDRAVLPAINSVGGFRFVSEKEDRDYTYEFLVKNILRPETEIEVAGQLFGATR